LILHTQTQPSRREFMHAALAGASLIAADTALGEETPTHPLPAQHVLPRWRGFNLHYFFGSWNNGLPIEDDYRKIRDLGFDFVRLPLWYTQWSSPANWKQMDETVLRRIDDAVGFARKHGLHTNLCFHRAPGYCVASEPREPFDLFTDQEALDAFCHHWQHFAHRYDGIEARELSFNLLNEPVAKREQHERVMRTAVAALRAISPKRPILLDGLRYAQAPLPELQDLGVAQSVHSYEPHRLSHYKAAWVAGADKLPEPSWPILRDGKAVYGREQLERYYAPWDALAASGVGIHCGECGCYNRTPHPVFIAWFSDVLDLLTARNIGYALWEFRGPFGLLDAERPGAVYEDWYGHRLDRQLMDLLRAH
jgi:endoglucanase